MLLRTAYPKSGIAGTLLPSLGNADGCLRDRGVLGRLEDGTPYHSPLGEITVDADEERV